MCMEPAARGPEEGEPIFANAPGPHLAESREAYRSSRFCRNVIIEKATGSGGGV